ncbi:winged helix DNA-binding domain-containing protein [Rathayibacter sp. CAU 1779]
MELTNAWLRAERLHAQDLDGRRRSPLDVVTRLGAVQAQNATAARWAIGVRTSGSSSAEVEQLFETGDAVRSWTMRGTLHVVRADDLAWMLSLTSARQRASAAREAVQRGITEADFERAASAVADHVAEHGPATRAEAVEALEQAGIDVGNERGYRFLRDAAFRGLVAWGPNRGKQPQLVAVRSDPDIDRDEALARFIIRYVNGHGPATVRDFAWWSGLTLTDARRARDAAGAHLEGVHVDECEYLVASDRADAGSRSRPSGVHAVPAWDEYVLGYGDRSPVLPPKHALRVSPTGNGVFLPVIVSAGRVVGTWSHAVRQGVLEATPHPFDDLSSAALQGFDRSIARFSHFLQALPA